MALKLFDSIIKGITPAQNFLSGFSPSKPTQPQETKIPNTPGFTPMFTPNKVPTFQSTTQNKTGSFIPQAKAGEPLVSDDEIKQMIDAGASDDEIKILVSELEKERSAPQQQQASQPDKSFMQQVGEGVQSFGQGAMNLTGGFVSEIPKIAGNVLGEATNLGAYTPGSVISAAVQAPFSDKTYSQIREEQKTAGEPLKKVGQSGKEFVQKYGAYDPNSTLAKVGETGADIISTVVGPGKIFKTAEKANVAIKALAALANTSIEGTTAAVSNYVATEGRLPTKEEVRDYIAISGGLKVGGKVFEQAKKLPSARLIPTTITEAGRDIRKGIDIGETISKTGISFTKGQLVKKIESKISGLSDLIDKHIGNAIKESGPSNVTIGSLTKGLKEKLMNSPETAKKLQGTPIDMKDISDSIDETIDAYKSLFGSKKLDLKAQQQLKKDIYSGISNVYNKPTTAKLTARQVTEKELAKTLKENVEVKVPEVAKLNKELSPLMEASKRLKAKGDYKTLLIDSIIGSTYAASQGSPINDPVGFAKNFAMGVLTKHLGTSTLAKTTTSTILNKTEQLFKNKEFQKFILDQYRQSNQK